MLCKLRLNVSVTAPLKSSDFILMVVVRIPFTYKLVSSNRFKGAGCGKAEHWIFGQHHVMLFGEYSGYE